MATIDEIIALNLYRVMMMWYFEMSSCVYYDVAIETISTFWHMIIALKIATSKLKYGVDGLPGKGKMITSRECLMDACNTAMLNNWF